MRIGLFGLLLALAVLAGRPAAALDAEDEKAREGQLKAADRDDAFLLRVNKAVRAGMDYVKAQQMEDGVFADSYEKEWPGGPTALSLLALLKSGLPKDDPTVVKGFEKLEKTPLRKTYSVGLSLMALEALYGPQKIEERIKGLTRAKPAHLKVPPRHLKWMNQLAHFLVKNMAYSQYTSKGSSAVGTKDCWSYPRDRTGDHSNTQYAILGLRSAQRCGVNVKRDTWEDIWSNVVDHFIAVQEKKGPAVKRWKLIEDKKHGYVSYKPVTRVVDTARGWAYGAGIKPKAGSRRAELATLGSMTTVGIASLLIGMEGLIRIRSKKLDAAAKGKIEKGVRDGLAWLDHHFSVEKNPGHPENHWLYYYLYGMERAAVLAGVRNIGKHDWYREGAEFLLEHQDGDGRWTFEATSGDLAPTCFALLFLTKATIPGGVKITR
jgi:hypothetical protein